MIVPAMIDPQRFREVMASFPSGVVVLTAFGDDSLPRGLTVSAFCAVSLQPPLALACIDINKRKIIGETTVGTAQHVALCPDGETVALEAADHQSVRVRHLPTGVERCVIAVKHATFAFAPARLASSSLRSSSAIKSPFFTTDPSSTVSFTMRPVICGLTITSLPSTIPINGMSLPRGVETR